MKSENHGRSHFAMVPNIVFQMGLPVYALGLYVHVVSTAGTKGECFKSARTLAKALKCSVGTITNAKRELLRRHGMIGFKPLIEIRSLPRRNGGKPYHVITPVPIWDNNERYYARRDAQKYGSMDAQLTTDVQNVPTPPAELASSLHDVASSSGDLNKNAQIKTKEQAPPSVSPSSRETGRAAQNLSQFWIFLCQLFDREQLRSPTRKERKQLLHWCPVPAEEYERVRWWMSMDENGYDYKEGVGFSLRRRPQSVGAILESWGDVNDVARSYWKQHQQHG
ncbi:MAG: helix-turn-helix domain-containing protein [Blastocatellia bacterium]|nr:helix-turn-helix domain-containing protein [Blastocatellia bacterium]